MVIKGRVVGRQKKTYEVDTGAGTVHATLRGVLNRRENRPIAGDLVDVDILNENSPEGQLCAVYERKNCLNRPARAARSGSSWTGASTAPAAGRVFGESILSRLHEEPAGLQGGE